MEYQLSPNQWLQIPMEIRAKLREIFNIPRSKGNILEGNVIKSDGHTFEDLAVITVEGMQRFTGSDNTDFMSLFNVTVNQIEDLIEPSVAQEPEIDPKQELIDEWSSVLVRMKQVAEEKQLSVYLEGIIIGIFDFFPKEVAEVTPILEEPKPKQAIKKTLYVENPTKGFKGHKKTN